jgi:hypothetical protein
VTERGWYAQLQDANLTEAEFERWQRLQKDGLSAPTALVVVLRARVSSPDAKDA